MIRSPTNLPVLIIDCDDVLNNLVSGWLSLYNKTYDDGLIEEDIKDWDIGKFTKVGKEMYRLLEIPGLFQGLDMQPDSYDVLNWAKDFFDLQVVSASNPKTFLEKSEWVTKNFPFIPSTSISSVYSKHIITGNVMVDDKPENLIFFDGKRIIYTKPWNKDITGITRADNWKQVKKILKDYLERNK